MTPGSCRAVAFEEVVERARHEVFISDLGFCDRTPCQPRWRFVGRNQMTFVAAKQFGNRIIVASDTMISDADETRHNVIPGRLKAVIVSPAVTIAYAGFADQALDAIRAARGALNTGAAIGDVESTLAATTARYPSDLDFLLVSHDGRDGSLKRIWEGRVSCALAHAAIGQRSLYAELVEREAQVRAPLTPSPFEGESAFIQAFGSLFDGVSVKPGVGGFPIVAVCSPFGHHYQSSGFVNSWDVIDLGRPVPEEQIADRKSGMTQWGYSTVAPKLRGIGVVGVLNTDAQFGFVYSPLSKDDPTLFRLGVGAVPTVPEVLHEFQILVDAEADRIGGGIADPVEDLPTGGPTVAELIQARAYAASAPCLTTITERDEALWIECEAGRSKIGLRMEFRGLGVDPVAQITGTIDRMIEDVTSRIPQ
jgi:hypothetical protein